MVDTFRVGLLLTKRCNIECSHCWFESGPNQSAQMTLEEATDYIDQAWEIPTVEWVSFTGGEPFLLPGMLTKLIGYASEIGLYTECVTNCFWAETEDKAETRLRELVDAGLYAISLSSDSFHQRHIPFERVRNCYEAARRLGLKITIMCAAARSSALRIGNISQLLGGKGIHIMGKGRPKAPVSALAVETGFIPVGRGASIPHEEWLIGEGPVEGPCRDVLRDIGIDPSGKVLPCCSAASRVEYAMLGYAKEERLADVIERASRRPVFKALSTDGPSELAKQLGLWRKGSYVNRCHLCYEVLSDPKVPQILD